MFDGVGGWDVLVPPPMPFACGFRREIENYLDMTHFSFAHGQTLGVAADAVLPLGAGPETSVAATKSYLAMLAASVALVVSLFHALDPRVDLGLAGVERVEAEAAGG